MCQFDVKAQTHSLTVNEVLQDDEARYHTTTVCVNFSPAWSEEKEPNELDYFLEKRNSKSNGKTVKVQRLKDDTVDLTSHSAAQRRILKKKKRSKEKERRQKSKHDIELTPTETENGK